MSTSPKTSFLRWLETRAASLFFDERRFFRLDVERVEDRLTCGGGRSGRKEAAIRLAPNIRAPVRRSEAGDNLPCAGRAGRCSYRADLRRKKKPASRPKATRRARISSASPMAKLRR